MSDRRLQDLIREHGKWVDPTPVAAEPVAIPVLAILAAASLFPMKATGLGRGDSGGAAWA